MFEALSQALKTVNGQKTNILVSIGMIILILGWIGAIDQEAVNQILTLLGLGGVYTIRDAMKKIQSTP